MFTLLQSFLLLVYFSVDADTRELQVLNSGIMKINRNDMAVMFFVTVKNVGKLPRRALITMIECCERITDDDTDCDLMDLYGGYFGVVEPGTEINFTLVYPNLYGYNRKGNCLVNVIHRCSFTSESSDSEEIHHRIEFDTSLSVDEVPPALRDWYDSKTFSSCDTPDLDPFDNCNPVDCQLKYSGNRNYFNRKWKMCQKVPVCKADPNKELPDVAYIPTSNTCRDLEKAVTKEDIDYLASIGPDKNQQKMVSIRCHHGEINPKTGICVCDQGWKSEVFDPDSYDGGTYSMCNIKCFGEDPYRLLPFLLGIALAVWLFFCVVCCVKLDCFCPGRKNYY